MTNRALPSPEILRQLLRYEPETGKLFWLPRGIEWFTGRSPAYQALSCRTWNKKFAGKQAGGLNHKGYMATKVLCQYIQCHRLIWAMYYGAWPTHQIDHIDGDRSNNTLSNLREVDNSENQRNGSVPASNKSGIVGVHFSPTHRKWRAFINIDRKKVHLGTFPSKEAAVAARRSAEVSGGYHPNHGKRPTQGK